MASSNFSLPLTPSSVVHMRATIMMDLATYTMLIYDLLITLGDEVKYIWPAPFSIPKALFLLNRYFVPLAFAIIIIQLNSPLWNRKKPICIHSVWDEAGFSLVATLVAEALMIIRVYALWGHKKIVLIGLGILWILHLIFGSLDTRNDVPVPIPNGLIGCIASGVGNLQVLYWAIPLVFDTVVFGLTLFKTWDLHRGGLRIPLIERFQRDGLIYFLIAFSGNLLNSILDEVAAPDLRGLTASFAPTITVVMISRLVLNLHGTSAATTSVFTTIVGSMGTEIIFDLDRPNPSSTLELELEVFSATETSPGV